MFRYLKFFIIFQFFVFEDDSIAMNCVKKFFEIHGQAYFKELLKDRVNNFIFLAIPILNIKRENSADEWLNNRYYRSVPLIIFCFLLFKYNNEKIGWKLGVLTLFLFNSIFYLKSRFFKKIINENFEKKYKSSHENFLEDSDSVVIEKIKKLCSCLFEESKDLKSLKLFNLSIEGELKILDIFGKNYSLSKNEIIKNMNGFLVIDEIQGIKFARKYCEKNFLLINDNNILQDNCPILSSLSGYFLQFNEEFVSFAATAIDKEKKINELAYLFTSEAKRGKGFGSLILYYILMKNGNNCFKFQSVPDKVEFYKKFGFESSEVLQNGSTEFESSSAKIFDILKNALEKCKN